MCPDLDLMILFRDDQQLKSSTCSLISDEKNAAIMCQWFSSNSTVSQSMALVKSSAGNYTLRDFIAGYCI